MHRTLRVKIALAACTLWQNSGKTRLSQNNIVMESIMLQFKLQNIWIKTKNNGGLQCSVFNHRGFRFSYILVVDVVTAFAWSFDIVFWMIRVLETCS